MRRGPLVRWGLLVGIVLLAVLVRVAVESRAAFVQGASARAEGDVEGAIFHFRASARFYAPMLPWPEEALDELLDIGRRAEERGDYVLALSAYDAVRAGTMGARSFYTPHADKLEAANARLPEVMARAREVHPTGPRSKPEDRPALEERFARAVATDHAPDPLLSTLAVLAFLGFVVSLLLGVWRSLPDEGVFLRRAALRWSLAAAGCFSAWLVLLAWV